VDLPEDRPDIVLTGSAGYIGERLATRLCADGHRVIGVDLLDPKFGHQNFRPYTVDLLDRAVREECFQEIQSIIRAGGGRAIIFHLAGVSSQADCERDPDHCNELNRDLVQKLLENSAKAGIDQHVLLSSAQLYDNAQSGPLDEKASLKLESVYAQSKYEAENELRLASKRTEIKARAIRISNTYGSSLKAGTVLEKIYQQILKGHPLEVDNESPIRDFIFIDDVIEGLIRLVRCPWTQPFEVINLGTGTGTSIRQLIALMERVFSSSAPRCLEPQAEREKKTDSIILDVSKLFKMTNWRPATDLATGLGHVRKGLMDA
jgi:nucleoside-diphosphate-sugar epimerase